MTFEQLPLYHSNEIASEGLFFYCYERPVWHCNFPGDVFWKRKDDFKVALISNCPNINDTLEVLGEIYTMVLLWEFFTLPIFFNQNIRGNKWSETHI